MPDTSDIEPYIQDLIRNVYTRIQPSTTHGVGVFAIKFIPKGTNIFAYVLSKSRHEREIKIPIELIFENRAIDENVKKIVKDFMTYEDGCVHMLEEGMNSLDITFYLNHSDTPNVETIDGETFFAMRDIGEGEELYSHYGTYTEEELSYIKKN